MDEKDETIARLESFAQSMMVVGYKVTQGPRFVKGEYELRMRRDKEILCMLFTPDIEGREVSQEMIDAHVRPIEPPHIDT